MAALNQGVFLDFDSIHPADLDLAALHASLPHWTLHGSTPPELAAARLAAAEVAVTNKVALDGELLRNASSLKLVCIAATGADRVDTAGAQRAGIAVSNVRDYATASVAEAVFTLLLALVRRIDRYRLRVSAGDWTRSAHFCLFDEPIEELDGKMLGIVGYGVLGHAVADRARAFGMQVQVAQRLHDEPLPDRVPLERLLATSDVISLHCPLSDATRNLIGHRQLQLMKRSAILINTARGGIVDEHALATALEQGRIAGAGVDVLGEEPPAADNPLLQCRAPGLIVTPHVAWASRGARQRLVNEIAANIVAFKRGEMRNRIV